MNASKIRELLIEDFFTRGLSYRDLARKYGRDETTCRRHILHYQRQYELDHGRRRDRDVLPVNRNKRDPEARPLSLNHAAIGMHMSRFMDRIPGDRTATAFGMLLTPMKSAAVINDALAGQYDWRLTELDNLAKVLGMTRDQLLTMESQRALA